VSEVAPPGWYPDPSGDAERRWWTGSSWATLTAGALAGDGDRSIVEPDQVDVEFDGGLAGMPGGAHVWRLLAVDGRLLGVAEGAPLWTGVPTATGVIVCQDGSGPQFRVTATSRAMLRRDLVVWAVDRDIGTISVRADAGVLCYRLQPAGDGMTSRIEISRTATETIVLDSDSRPIARLVISVSRRGSDHPSASAVQPGCRVAILISFASRPTPDVRLLMLAGAIVASADLYRRRSIGSDADGVLGKLAEAFDFSGSDGGDDRDLDWDFDFGD
jgi:hypothetical protein